MKRENANYFFVGCFVLAAFSLLLYVMFRLTGGIGEHDPYHVYYPNVGGLKEGTPVTYEGFKIGSVSSIVPERSTRGTRYRVDLLLRDGWRIPVGSLARVYSEGLLAETVIDIDEGDSTAYLSLGAELAGVQNRDLFATVNSVAGDLSLLLNDTVKPLLDNLNGDISSLGTHIDQGLPEILRGIRQLVQTLQSSADQLPRLLGEQSEAKVDSILENTQRMTANLLSLSQALMKTQQKADLLLAQSNGTIQDNRKNIGLAVVALQQSLEDISAHTDGILQNLEGTTHNLNEFSRKIRQNPGLLLSNKPPVEEGVTSE